MKATQLASSYRNSLKLATSNSLHSIVCHIPASSYNPLLHLFTNRLFHLFLRVYMVILSKMLLISLSKKFANTWTPTMGKVFVKIQIWILLRLTFWSLSCTAWFSWFSMILIRTCTSKYWVAHDLCVCQLTMSYLYPKTYLTVVLPFCVKNSTAISTLKLG